MKLLNQMFMYAYINFKKLTRELIDNEIYQKKI